MDLPEINGANEGNGWRGRMEAEVANLMKDHERLRDEVEKTHTELWSQINEQARIQNAHLQQSATGFADLGQARKDIDAIKPRVEWLQNNFWKAMGIAMALMAMLSLIGPAISAALFGPGK